MTKMPITLERGRDGQPAPVLPEVGSMIVLPGLSRPARPPPDHRKADRS
jgi:hypothetical protein